VVDPLHPVGQEQVFGATHVPPFSHGIEQIAEMKLISTKTMQMKIRGILMEKWSYLRVEHPVVAPVHPTIQEQLFGALHVPPFWQGTEQIAVINVILILKYSNKKKRN
jgi:hypothetical protein